MNNSLLLTEPEAAQRLRVATSTLSAMRKTGRAPHVVIGRKPLYSENDLQRIIELCHRNSNDQEKLPTNNTGLASNHEASTGVGRGMTMQLDKHDASRLARQIFSPPTRN